MTRSILTRSELLSRRESLCQWHDPIEFSVAVSRLASAMTSRQFFTDPHAAFLRDAWVAARFGAATSPLGIRLTMEWPDFECRVGAAICSYEITEADEPGRRRGLEYKSGLHDGWRHDPVGDWVRRANEAPGAMRAAVERKAGRRYPRTTRLVVYLNIGEYGIRQREIKAAMHAATELGASAFDEVWVSWKQQLYLLWKQGQPSREILAIPMANEAA